MEIVFTSDPFSPSPTFVVKKSKKPQPTIKLIQPAKKKKESYTKKLMQRMKR